MMELMRKILIVEDEEKIAGVIQSLLESKGFQVLWAEDGQRALELFDLEAFSLVLLDLMLPKISGEEVCNCIRRKSLVPIIMLTAKSSEADLLQGLHIGADDYIVKPFSLKTLYARIEAVLRRSEDDLVPLYEKRSYFNDDLIIDLATRQVIKKEKVVKLTPNEYKILSQFVCHPNKVYTREELITAAFGDEFDGYDRTVDSHIKNLRAKLEDDPRNPIYIKTVHGIGYRFGGESSEEY